ncbi:DUF2705 family protein [Terrilactibacillus sp. S3-3]|nr:DUF2705 family protein [Terrilactibacillus sp. S3-3]
MQWNTHFDPYIAFLLAGESEGHITQILLFWFLPIYLLILCSDDYIQDVKTGYNNILIVKIGKADYIRDKFITSFLFPCLTMLFSLAINLVLSVIIFAGGTESSMMKIHDPANILFNFSQVHPLLIDIIFSLNVSLFAGLAGMLGASASFIFPDRNICLSAFFFFYLVHIGGIA